MTQKVEGFSITFRYMLKSKKDVRGNMFFEITNETETIVIEGTISPKGLVCIPAHEFDGIIEHLLSSKPGFVEVNESE